MQALPRIVHNRKVLMTEQEWQDYQNIAASYNRPGFKGEDLFRGLFNTDDDGNIVAIGVPSGAQVSMEIFFFVCALYEHQKMRVWEARVDALCSKLEEMDRKLSSSVANDA